MRPLFKFLIVFSFILLAKGSIEEWNKKISEVHKICIAESGLSEEIHQKANTEKIFPEDQVFKCYLKCLYNEFRTIIDGKIDMDAILEAIPDHHKDEWIPIIHKCGIPNGKDLCDTAYLAIKCISEANPDGFYLI